MRKQDRPFADMLPELYQQDEILDTFLQVLECCHLDLEQWIEKMPETLYTDKAPSSFLGFLGSLAGLYNHWDQFSEKQMRGLLPDAFWLHRWKGTRLALEFLLYRYLELLCGYPVRFWITEPDEKEAPSIQEGPPLITVHIVSDPHLESQGTRQRLEAAVRDFVPAAVSCQVIYGEQGTLGKAYLGYSTHL